MQGLFFTNVPAANPSLCTHWTVLPLYAEEPVRKIYDISLISYLQLQAQCCACYASAEANGRSADSILGDVKAICKWQYCHKLVIPTWNIVSLIVEAHGLVEEAKRYSVVVVSMSLIERRNSNNVQ